MPQLQVLHLLPKKGVVNEIVSISIQDVQLTSTQIQTWEKVLAAHPAVKLPVNANNPYGFSKDGLLKTVSKDKVEIDFDGTTVGFALGFFDNTIAELNAEVGKNITLLFNKENFSSGPPIGRKHFYKLRK